MIISKTVKLGTGHCKSVFILNYFRKLQKNGLVGWSKVGWSKSREVLRASALKRAEVRRIKKRIKVALFITSIDLHSF